MAHTMTENQQTRQSMRPLLGRMLAGVLITAVGGAALIGLHYRTAMHTHAARIAAGSLLADTPCGMIEYGDQGSGQPVLVIHGSGGGYDQGLYFGQPLGSAFRIIAPSRFGYLNTPLPAAASVTDQADAYACLLDHLNIDRAAVMAISAGGPSALQFAQRHPDRVDALVMVSAISDVRPVREADEAAQAALLNDFTYWAAVSAMPGTVLEFFGFSLAAQQQLTPAEVDRAKTALALMLPLSSRTAGLAYDSVEANLFDGAAFTLEAITAPTLAVHAADDTFIPPVHARTTADRIPGAQLRIFETGGHFVLARQDAIDTIVAFLQTAGAA
jgi:2-hydroxy-6-oxonona-2,4-dienedioate hydrolase